MNDDEHYAALYCSKFPNKDKLDEIKRIIKWDLFRPILNGLFKGTEVGRPHVDVVVMAKMLVLQAWYSLSDEQLEIQCKDRLTFQNFLGYPESVPDARTVWLFRERLASSGKEGEFWELLNSQLKGLKVKEGESKDVVFMKVGEKEVEASKDNAHLQDSTVLEADSGAPTVGDIIRREQNEAKGDAKDGKGTSISISYDELKKSKERGDEAKTRRSVDGTWTKKRNKSYFGYKLHTKVVAKSGLIEDYEVTTASLHDNRVDFSLPGEPMVRDKAYSFVSAKGIPFTMIGASRGNPLSDDDRAVNRILSSIRAHVEHPYAVMRRVFHFTRMYITTIKRISVRAMFMCMSFNLMRIAYLLRPGD